MEYIRSLSLSIEVLSSNANLALHHPNFHSEFSGNEERSWQQCKFLKRQDKSKRSVKLYEEQHSGAAIVQAIFWSVEEVARRAKYLYENGIRQKVESEDNIGKMIVIDSETGEYGIDKTGVETALKLKQKNPHARLFTLRIGYDVAVSFGGAIERTVQ